MWSRNELSSLAEVSLYKQRIRQKLQEITESSSIVLEWRNIKTIMLQAAEEILGKMQSIYKKEKKEKYVKMR